MEKREFLPMTRMRLESESFYQELRRYCLQERKWLRKTGVAVDSTVLVVDSTMNEGLIYDDAQMRMPPSCIVGQKACVTGVFAESDSDLPFGLLITPHVDAVVNPDEFNDEWAVPFYCLVPIGD